MAFGKRGSDRSHQAPTEISPPLNDPTSDNVYRQQTPQIRKFIDFIARIQSQAFRLAIAIRQGVPLRVEGNDPHFHSPFELEGFEKLFEETGKDGETVYLMFYFSLNLKSMDSKAQFFLSELYKNALMFNIDAKRHGAGGHTDGINTDGLDAIMVQSAYFLSYFRAAAMTTEIVSGQRAASELQRDVDASGREFMQRLAEARSRMFRQERFSNYVPWPHASLAVYTGQPYEDGQWIINGVYFPRQYAEPMRREIADLQTKAIGEANRQRRTS